MEPRDDCALEDGPFDFVGVRRYPRPGEPLVPRLLYPSLAAGIPADALVNDDGSPLTYADFDATVWDMLSHEQVLARAEMIVGHATATLSIEPGVLFMTLGEAGGRGKRTLVVGRRTHTVLDREGLLDSRAAFCAMTVQDALLLRSFGMRSLLDLLIALEVPDVQEVEWGGSPSVQLTILPDEFQYVEDEMRAVVIRLSRSSRNAEMTLARLGFGPEAPQTLQQVGEAYGLTRERVRQVGNRSLRRIKSEMRGPLPRLDSALDLLSAHCPLDQDEADSLLLKAGLTATGVSLAGLETACRLFGNGELEVRRVGSAAVLDSRFEGRAVSEHGWAEALSVARKACSAAGAATVADIAARVWDHYREWEVDDAEALVRLVVRHEDFIILDDATGWFWRPKGRNRLLNNIRRVLSVVDAVDARELRRCVRREYRMHGYAPPSRVLVALARSSAMLDTDGESIWSKRPVSRTEALSDTERTLVDLLAASGGVMSSRDIEPAVLTLGVGRPALYRALSYSPVIRKYGAAVYGVIGAQPSAALVERLESRGPRRRVLEECGWLEDGRPWLIYRLSESSIASGVLPVPASLREFMEGEYDLASSTGEMLGTFVSKGYSCWGLGPPFRRFGIEHGDWMLLLVDLQARRVVCHVGDENMPHEVLGYSRRSTE